MTAPKALATVTLTADEARRLTERIRLTAQTFAESRERLIALVDEARGGSAHLALGYASWPAYLADVLGEEPLRLARDERRGLVELLRGEGMSTRAIAPIVGVDQKTVVNDIRSTEEISSVERSPTVTSLDGRQRPTTQPPRVVRLEPHPGVATIIDVATGAVIDPTPRTPAKAPARQSLGVYRRPEVVDVMARVIARGGDLVVLADSVTERMLRGRSGDAAVWRERVIELIEPLQSLANLLGRASGDSE